jgi:hypothetical protein
VIKTIGMVARFDPTTDVTLDELRIELMYPLDAEADDYFRSRHEQARPRPAHRGMADGDLTGVGSGAG